MIRISKKFNKGSFEFIIIKSVTKYKTTKKKFSEGLMVRHNNSSYLINLSVKIFTGILFYMLKLF